MVLDEPCLLLSIVLPISDEDLRIYSCAKADIVEETAHDNVQQPNRQPSELDDSGCTEEEKVALEQLTELQRIRELSYQEDGNDSSCSTGNSFKSFGTEKFMPLGSSLMPNDHIQSSSSPDASHSAACIIDIWNSRCQQNLNKYTSEVEVVSIQDQDIFLPCVDADDDSDGRHKPRSRLLTELYQQDSRQIQQWKASKKRRRTMTKLMALENSYVNDHRVK
ncbi:hypothetical protein KP509_13G098700 [Ceratopteris richardii]|uniref:Uncharacterized protein n=2 Tax=Ceratopteris richardii TaxID=49495 RepID=A0A8T2TFX1_CERRI|nr:hypothetical protein KP509_13G098700 [Ceratopteris richardii]